MKILLYCFKLICSGSCSRSHIVEIKTLALLFTWTASWHFEESVVILIWIVMPLIWYFLCSFHLYNSIILFTCIALINILGRDVLLSKDAKGERKETILANQFTLLFCRWWDALSIGGISYSLNSSFLVYIGLWFSSRYIDIWRGKRITENCFWCENISGCFDSL